MALMDKPKDFWRDRLETPAYRIGEAAAFACVSPSTVSSWEKTYRNRYSAVSKREPKYGLTFLQLIEVAVVARLRKAGVKLNRIRNARDFFSRRLETNYPFARQRFLSDGVDILLEDPSVDLKTVDVLIIANENGQLMWSSFIQERLLEFNYDDDGYAIRWYPRGRSNSVSIDPRISFGEPAAQGISTRAIKSQWNGDSDVPEIAEDFGITQAAVIDALRFEGIIISGNEA